MNNTSLLKNIARRTSSEVYIGVVGPVRTGKSTFIKRFMEQLVVPNMEEGPAKQRALDELPQTACGKTIMTTEPKFVPEQAAHIALEEGLSLKMRLIDCVGYIVPSALGHMEGQGQRMVNSPWFSEDITFEQAAEIGTGKVIEDHSTIGIVVTTDGSVTDIPRQDYISAERRVVEQLKGLKKPFVVLLNCENPASDDAISLSKQLTREYAVPVLPVNCEKLQGEDIKLILSIVTRQFPVLQMDFDLPAWVCSLPQDHWLRRSVMDSIFAYASAVSRMSDAKAKLDTLCECEHITSAQVTEADLGSGRVQVKAQLDGELFYRVLGEQTGLCIENEGDLLGCMIKLSRLKTRYEKVADALAQVENTGYGVVMPSLNELRLAEPEITNSQGRYGVKLKASAPSIHMMRADIEAEVNPIVGSEKQSQELVMYLLREFEQDPSKIWDSNIFGKSLSELVNEGLQNKLYHMPDRAREKLRETLQRIINEGCAGLICIIL